MAIFRSFWKSPETIQKCFPSFYDFLKFSENLRKSSEAFGNLRKFSENFGNGSEVIFRCFHDFLKVSENLRKSLEIFGKLRKRFKSNFQMFLWFFNFFNLRGTIGQLRPLHGKNRKLHWNLRAHYTGDQDSLNHAEEIANYAKIWEHITRKNRSNTRSILKSSLTFKLFDQIEAIQRRAVKTILHHLPYDDGLSALNLTTLYHEAFSIELFTILCKEMDAFQ